MSGVGPWIQPRGAGRAAWVGIDEGGPVGVASATGQLRENASFGFGETQWAGTAASMRFTTSSVVMS
ncbi:MAG: hypothetical protein ACI8V4_001626 [Ilumatobacter sp.]|jgi:hypothetical protein